MIIFETRIPNNLSLSLSLSLCLFLSQIILFLGTLCYCDEFCNQTRVDDCCPDYWSHCRGITPPPPTEAPPEPQYGCTYGNRALRWKQEVKENCNKW